MEEDYVAPNARHGTRSGYRHHKCRCPECKTWNTEYNRAYWERREARGGGSKPVGWITYNRRRDYD